MKQLTGIFWINKEGGKFMQIIFIHHSCFLVELDDKVLIFDYFDGNKVEGMHFTGKLPSYEPDTKIYMFASHSHKDHYDMDILRLAGKYSNIHYIFSFYYLHYINKSLTIN